MTKNWNNLPLEMKEMVVDRTDVVTRIKLSMCSKADNVLVKQREYEENRRIKFESDDESINLQFPSDSAMNGSVLRIHQGCYRQCELSTNSAKSLNFSNKENLKETVIRVLNRFACHGIIVNSVDNEFKEMFLWLRRNFELRPPIVNVIFPPGVCNEQSMFIETYINWGKDTKVSVRLHGGKPSIFQRRKTYPQICEICFLNYKEVYIADEYLKKMPNLKRLTLMGWKVTVNWFHEFVNVEISLTNRYCNKNFIYQNWIHRPYDQKDYYLNLDETSWSVNDIEKGLQGTIEYSERRVSQKSYCEPYNYWQIALKKDEDTFGLIDIEDKTVNFHVVHNAQSVSWRCL